MKPIASVLLRLFRDSPQHPVWVLAYLEGSWESIVGDGIARVCRPRGLDNRNLLIEILDPSWERAFKSMERDMLEKIRQFAANEVTRISFCVTASQNC
jgi:hypothetical protein